MDFQKKMSDEFALKINDEEWRKLIGDSASQALCNATYLEKVNEETLYKVSRIIGDVTESGVLSLIWNMKEKNNG